MVRSSICQLLEVLFRSVSYLKKYLFGSVNYLKQYFFWKSNFPLTRFSPSVGWTFCHNFQKGGKLLFHAPISANTVTANLYYITIHHQDQILKMLQQSSHSRPTSHHTTARKNCRTHSSYSTHKWANEKGKKIILSNDNFEYVQCTPKASCTDASQVFLLNQKTLHI